MVGVTVGGTVCVTGGGTGVGVAGVEQNRLSTPNMVITLMILREFFIPAPNILRRAKLNSILLLFDGNRGLSFLKEVDAVRRWFIW